MSETPKPSATVVVVRDGASGLELLLLERNREAGPWVFPGGKVDANESAHAVEVAARRAAVREAREEAGLELDADALLAISRWITPPLSRKRFDTWFFLARVPTTTEVRVDGSEIRSHRWFKPAEAVEAHHDGRIQLAPPTFVTTQWLTRHARADEALQRLAAAEFIVFEPRICSIPDGACILYPGDAGYAARDPEAVGPRHRLWTLPDGWRYEHS